MSATELINPNPVVHQRKDTGAKKVSRPKLA